MSTSASPRRTLPDGPEPSAPPGVGKSTSAKQLALGFVFGVVFGFLLQKGGVAKYHVLIGMLLLEDFTVAKVMLSAIVVGTVGIFLLYFFKAVQLHVKPTRYAANIVGGLVFGIGFGLIGYCPGTGAAALGQGNLDAIAGVMGLMVGSYAYAEASGYLGKTVAKVGERGKLLLPDLVHVGLKPFLIVWVPILIGVLYLLDHFTAR